MTRHSSPVAPYAWLAALLLLTPALAGAQATPLVVTTDWLAAHLADANVLVVQAGGRQPEGKEERIPGTRYLAYASFTPTVNGLANELPTPDSLRSLFESVGVSDDSHVVLVGQPLSVTRLFYTMDYFSLPRLSVLDGGLAKWKREGRRVDTAQAVVTRGRLSPRAPRAEAVASTDWVIANARKPGIALFDTRSMMEYVGTEGANGHIDGARFIDWRQYFMNQTDFELVDRATLEKLFAERARPGDTVVAYCAVGYRASGTYFISRLLGVPVKLYDGSYDAWSKRALPSVTAATPLLTGVGLANTGGELPAVSPDGRFIAYVALRDGKQTDTYVARADGSGERQLTHTAERDERPSWIGSRVFTAVRAGDSTRATVMDADGKHARAASIFAGREPNPSSNGDFVISLAGEPSPRLFVAGGSGSGARAITDGKSPAPSYAVWSPDGSRIAYATFDFGSRNMQVFVMNADGGGAQMLTAIPQTDGRVARPAWSPDGRTIAFQVRQESPTSARSHIYLVDAATKAVTKLAPHDEAYVDEAPSWFPDGNRIAFQSNRSGAMQIWTMTRAGTEARQITTWRATP